MWSQLSSNCTIDGLSIMTDYLQSDYDESLELAIADDGTLSFQTSKHIIIP